MRDLDLPMGVDWARMDHRRGLLKLVDEKFRRMDKTGIAESMESYYQTALDLMRSEKAKKTFAIEDEPDAVRDRYGRTSTGQGALLARDIEKCAREEASSTYSPTSTATSPRARACT